MLYTLSRYMLLVRVHTIRAADAQLVLRFAVGDSSKRSLHDERCHFILLLSLEHYRVFILDTMQHGYQPCVVTPTDGPSTCVLANTVKISAMPPLEIQILLPLSRKCLPSSESVARVWMEAASLPL